MDACVFFIVQRVDNEKRIPFAVFDAPRAVFFLNVQ